MINRRFYIPLLTVAATLLIAFGATAASAKTTGPETKKTGKDGARAAFNADDNTLGLSIGFGTLWTYGYFFNVHSSPAVSLYYDHGITDHAGPGTIGIGGVISYQSTHFDYVSGGNRSRLTNFIIAARGTYHLTILKDKNNKFDPYGGVTIGFRSTSYSSDAPGNDVHAQPYLTGVMGVFAGAKYNFMPRFGAFAEVGYDISFLRLGAHLNF